MIEGTDIEDDEGFEVIEGNCVGVEGEAIDVSEIEGIDKEDTESD